MAIDKKGLIWFCGNEDGLFVFDPLTKKTNHIENSNPLSRSLGGDLKKMIFDDNGNLWISTIGFGLFCYNPKLNTFKNWNANDKGLASSYIRDIKQAQNGKLWLATNADGLVLMDIEKETFVHYKNRPNDNSSINTNILYSIYIEKNQTLWIGTFNGGVNFCNPNQLMFTSFKPDILDVNSLSNKSVLCMLEDKDQNLWIGTDGGGLNLYNPQKYGERFIHFPTKTDYSKKSSPPVIKSMYQDKDGYIWLGTWMLGMARFDPQKWEFDYTLNNKANIANKGVWGFLEDDQQNMWVSLIGEGLLRINRKTFVTKKFTKTSNCGLANQYFLCVFKDRKGRQWFGSEGSGLYLYQTKTETFKNYSYNEKNKKSIAGNIVQTIFEDSKGQLWIGTLGDGFSMFNEKTDDFTNIGANDGFKSKTVNAINEDKHGMLWIATNNGMVKYNPVNKKFKSYTKLDGLQGDKFNYCATNSTKSGSLVFGGQEGMNIFDPEKIKDNEINPPLFITGISILNEAVTVNDKTQILKKSLQETNTIYLTHNQYVISFKYTALNYTQLQKNVYACMLENFDEKWTIAGNKKEATYTNLDPGEYNFKVKVGNNDGLWYKNETSLKIIVLPPYWKTWWFRLTLFLFIAGITVGILLLRIKSLQKQKVLLEGMVQNRTKELKESNSLLVLRQNEILEQSKVLNDQSNELNVTNEYLKQIQEQTMSSIRCAYTIQQAMLPMDQILNEKFGAFVIFQPKDVVSGDFFWYHVQPATAKSLEKTFYAVVDCTGHGVPGAFMSLIGNRILNSVIVEKEILDPAIILKHLDSEIKKALKQEFSNNNDGMDAGICLIEHIDESNFKVTFAGAKNNLLISRQNTNEVQLIKGNRRSIGGIRIRREPLPFIDLSVELEKGTRLYLYTDGIVDQCNNLRKSFGIENLMKTVLASKDLDLLNQKTYIVNKLNEYTENVAQRDDITFIGIIL